MKNLIITIIAVLSMLLISCPKQSDQLPDGGSFPMFGGIDKIPLMTTLKLKERIDGTGSSFVTDPRTDYPMCFFITYHKANDDYGKYLAKDPRNYGDFGSMYFKEYSIQGDTYLPENPELFFIGVRIVKNGEVEKYARLIQPQEHLEILNKVVSMDILSLNNPAHIKFASTLYLEKNISKDYILVTVSNTFISSGYSENKQSIEDFVSWFDNKYYSTIVKEENKVTYFPSEGQELPRPEKY